MNLSFTQMRKWTIGGDRMQDLDENGELIQHLSR
jgi:hypothetical protein